MRLAHSGSFLINAKKSGVTMPVVVCHTCGQSFEVRPYREHLAKYCSRECQSLAFQKNNKKCKCKCCGKEFPGRGNAIFCDKACGHAFRAGLSREEWLEEHPQSNQSTLLKRKCHDCGKPTNNYRCSACWEKLRSEYETGGIPEYQVMGQAWV